MNKETIRKTSFIAGTIVIVIGLIVYFFSSFSTGAIPADFTAARQKAAAVSQDIVNLTSQTNQKINEANKIQNTANADIDRLLGVINDAKGTNATAYQKAFELSRTLQDMAQSLRGVSQPRQQLGYEAVALELSLVSEFISYTGTLNDFLNNLSKAVVSQSAAAQRSVEDALSKVNQKANLINSINKNFLDKMAAFDQANGL